MDMQEFFAAPSLTQVLPNLDGMHTTEAKYPLNYSALKSAYDSCCYNNIEPNRIYLPTKSFAAALRAIEDSILVEMFLGHRPFKFFNGIFELDTKLDNSKVLAKIVNTDFVGEEKYNCAILNEN